MVFCLKPESLCRVHSIQSTSYIGMLAGSTKPVWQTQLWIEPVTQGLNSQSVLLFMENPTLPLTSPNEPAAGKPQGTYPPILSENATASIQTLWFAQIQEPEWFWYAFCCLLEVSGGILEANILTGSPPVLRGSVEQNNATCLGREGAHTSHIDSV